MQLFRTGIGIGLFAAALLAAQAPQRTRVLGTLTAVSAGGASMKTDSGAVVLLSFGPETRYQKVAPGEKDLAKAQPIASSDLASGDRVLARGAASEDGKTLAAQSVIVMSGADIARKREKERAEWTLRGMAGLAVSIDTAKNEIQLRIPSLMGQARTATVALKESTRFRRYAPDSVRFDNAKPGTLADIQPGDQLRILGDKSEDASRIAADEIVSGSFHTVAGSVTATDPATGELQMKDLQSGTLLTVKVTPDSSLRRLPEFGMFRMGGAAGGPGGPGGPPPGGGASGGPGGMRGGAPDLQQMLERLPPATLAEIKTGETIIVSSTRGANPNHLTAVTLLAGADALLAMREASAARGQGPRVSSGSQSMGSWNLGDMSVITSTQ